MKWHFTIVYVDANDHPSLDHVVTRIVIADTFDDAISTLQSTLQSEGKTLKTAKLDLIEV